MNKQQLQEDHVYGEVLDEQVNEMRVRVDSTIEFVDESMTLKKLVESNKDIEQLIDVILRAMVDYKIKKIEIK